MLDVVARFGTIPFDGLLVTKLDETSTFGPILNLVRQTGKPVTYLTNGQNVPHDIAVASSSGLTDLLARRDLRDRQTASARAGPRRRRGVVALDQAAALRELMRPTPRQPLRQTRVIAVASGKGGVGKTSLTVNLAIALAREGKRAVVLDGDLGLANVDVLLGIHPRYTLAARHRRPALARRGDGARRRAGSGSSRARPGSRRWPTCPRSSAST